MDIGLQDNYFLLFGVEFAFCIIPSEKVIQCGWGALGKAMHCKKASMRRDAFDVCNVILGLKF